ncbi:MAG: hypothetical protein IPP71_21460 [Bacteroidetes bacterium]|nr:hypothetical protein [Bacteroidota bacterium]
MTSLGGVYKEGWVTAKTRVLGKFSLFIDTIPPVIMDPIFKEDPLSGNLKLVIPFKPDLTGIKIYTCKINGEWVCGEYNSFRNEIEIYFKTPLQQGTEIVLDVEAEDGNGNKSLKNTIAEYRNPD